jgi:Ca-activated chloride channel family protein
MESSMRKAVVASAGLLLLPACALIRPEIPAPPPPPPPAVMAPMAPAPPMMRTAEANTESYATIDENAFRAVAQHPLSTFSADVDRASYANVRRFLVEGRRPPRDAVRIEEMINYFPYEPPARRGDEPIAVATEVGDAPWRAGHQLLRIGLSTAPVELRNAPAGNLVFLIDVSGSMNGPDRLPLVKRSLRLLVDQLREDDRVAIVVYAGAAGLVLPSTRGSDRRTILDAIERLEAGGSTAAAKACGWPTTSRGATSSAAATTASSWPRRRLQRRRIQRCGDGAADRGEAARGDVPDGAGLRPRQPQGQQDGAARRPRKRQLRLHRQPAGGPQGPGERDGRHAADRGQGREAPGGVQPVAGEGVPADRLREPAAGQRRLQRRRQDAGEMGAGHTVTALYEIIPVGVRSDAVGPRRGLAPLPRPHAGARPRARRGAGLRQGALQAP